MKITKKSASLLMLMLTCTATQAVFAQTPSKADVPPPPKLEKLEEVSDPKGISVSKPEPKNKMMEKRSNGGKVTEVQVKSGKSNYTVKADPEVGNAPKGTVQGDANRAAQWTILEFGGKKEVKEGNPPDVLAPAQAKSAATASSAASK
ncbi:MAG: hypothetical protein WA071_28955 [Undibacterium umbellatum]|jgi:hypothetical protein|uniref:hypothetical protein n=1 Tax=Undibacterium TaxID=401469 RepID=UPI0027312486|nr:hypothetical protein [Undibacterium sp.]MDP1976537.1 hypothetical protein [Undibacterium sp.]